MAHTQIINEGDDFSLLYRFKNGRIIIFRIYPDGEFYIMDVQNTTELNKINLLDYKEPK